ncbi:MAG: chemotaxis protein CheW [Burkholderiales bacterium]
MTPTNNVQELQSSATGGDAASEATQTARLSVLAGGHYWLLRLDEAQEVIAVTSITPVPLTKNWFRGIVNVRGNLYSVVDLGRFALEHNATVSGDARIVVLADRFRVSAALLVEKMLGLRTVQSLQPDPAPPEYPWVCANWRDADGRAWREISITELVRHNDFLQAGI